MSQLVAVSQPAIGLAMAGGSMLIFALCALLTARAARQLDSDSGALLAAGITLPVGLFIALLQFAGGHAIGAPSARGLAAFALAGVFSTYLGRWLFFKAIETMGPTRATVFQISSPIITALAGWVFLGERIGLWSLLGMGLAVAGLVTISQSSKVSKRDARYPPLAATALLIGLGGTTAYAVSHVFRGAAVRDWNEPVLGATLGAAAGLAALLLVSRKRLGATRLRIAQQPRAALLYAAIGSMQLGGQVLMIAAMKHIPVSVAALIAMCTPLVVMPASALLMKNAEQVRLGAAIGVLATVLGVALVVLNGAAR